MVSWLTLVDQSEPVAHHYDMVNGQGEGWERGEQGGNAAFDGVWHEGRPHVIVVASKDIPRHAEVLSDYGEEYWKDLLLAERGPRAVAEGQVRAWLANWEAWRFVNDDGGADCKKGAGQLCLQAQGTVASGCKKRGRNESGGRGSGRGGGCGGRGGGRHGDDKRRKVLNKG